LGIAAVGYLNDPTVTDVLSQTLFWLVIILLISFFFTVFKYDSKIDTTFIALFKIKFIEITSHCMFILFVSSKFAQSSPVLSIPLMLCYFGVIMPIFYKYTNDLKSEPKTPENLFLLSLRSFISNILLLLLIIILVFFLLLFTGGVRFG
jgi:hypothetical protein